MPHGVPVILSGRTPVEVLGPVVGWVTVYVQSTEALRLRTVPRFRNQLMHTATVMFGVSRQVNVAVAVPISLERQQPLWSHVRLTTRYVDGSR